MSPALIDVHQSKSQKIEKQMLAGFEQVCKRNLLSAEVINHFNDNWMELQNEV